MKDEDFLDLHNSIKEAGEIMPKDMKPPCVAHIEKLDVFEIRKKVNLSQWQLAALLGVSLRTIKSWEKGLYSPKGASRVLLELANHNSQVFLQLFLRNSYLEYNSDDYVFVKKDEYEELLNLLEDFNLYIEAEKRSKNNNNGVIFSSERVFDELGIDVSEIDQTDVEIE